VDEDQRHDLLRRAEDEVRRVSRELLGVRVEVITWNVFSVSKSTRSGGQDRYRIAASTLSPDVAMAGAVTAERDGYGQGQPGWDAASTGSQAQDRRAISVH